MTSVIGQSSTSLASAVHRSHLRLKNARYTTAFFVDPTDTTVTEDKVFADAWDTHGAGVFGGLLENIKVGPGIRTLLYSC